MIRKLVRLLAVLFALELLWLSINAVRVLHFASLDPPTCAAEAAVVLGAAVWNDLPSPVFEARLRHAVDLYLGEQVHRLVFTGGRAEGDELAESEVGRAYAIARGVPADAIAVETTSWTTRGNAEGAVEILRAVGVSRVVVVSDALHLRRAVLMFEDLGMRACSSPTPYTRYRSWRTRWPFLAREAIFLQVYQVVGR